MSLLVTLLKIETIKTVRRFGFWITLLALGGFLVLVHGGTYYGAVQVGEPPPHLPDAWWGGIFNISPLAGFFGAVALILLVASEFSWNTARQNVIDGLSKDQFFLAKLLLVPVMALLVLGVQLGVGGATALLGNLHLGEPAWPPLRWLHLGFMTGLLVQFTGFLALAFLAAMIARSAGGAMGLFLLYAAVLEQILSGLLRRWEGWSATAADLLPVSAFSEVARPEVWDAEVLAAAAQRAAAQGQPPPEVLGAPASVGIALGWIGALVLLALLVYRRRDL